VSSESVDVVVVGAGFAGLSAARALGKRGLSARVLEARDRTGGRTYTKVLPGGPWVDLGGQWIGPTQDRVLRLVEELGVETFPTYTAGHNLLVVRGKKSRYRGTIPRLDPMSLLNISFAQWRLESMSRKVPLEAPWRTAKAAEWDARTLASFLDANVKTRTARTLIEVGLETVFAASSKEMSLLHALFYIRSGKDLDMLLGTEGGAQATRIKGGMQRLAERLAEGLDVRLSAPVRRIEHDGSGVTAHADGASIRAQRAVVSVPPKLASQMAFDPPLVGPRAELVTKTPMGAAIKCTAVYEEPFWRDDGLSGMCVSDEGPIHVTFDNSPPEGTPGVLMGFCDADSARALGKLSEAGRRDAAGACFARYFGERARAPRAYVDHVWELDPWSGGCYGAFMPPGVWTSLGPAIRAPEGRIHFAGTETATVWSGFIDGAIESGERVAEEIAAAERGQSPARGGADALAPRQASL
jgi:monoamine oxidase